MRFLYAVHRDRPTIDPPDVLFRTEDEARQYAAQLERPATVSRWVVGTRDDPINERTVIAVLNAEKDTP